MAEAERSKAEAAGGAPGLRRDNLEDLLKRIASHISEAEEAMGRPPVEFPPELMADTDAGDREPPVLRSGLSRSGTADVGAAPDGSQPAAYRAVPLSDPPHRQPATTRPGAPYAESFDNAGMGTLPDASVEDTSTPPLRTMLDLMAAVPRARAAASRAEAPAAPQHGELPPEQAANADRLAIVARRIEDALATLAPRDAVDRLGDRFARLESEMSRTTAELERLDGIEARLGVLSTRLTDEQIVSLFAPLVPTAEDLTRFAEDAAGRIAERMPTVGSGAVSGRGLAEEPAERGDGQIKALGELLTSYVDECRRRDAGTQEALETLQLAMKHVLDRLEQGDAPAGLESAPPASHAPPERLGSERFEHELMAPERMPGEMPAHLAFEHGMEFGPVSEPHAHTVGPHDTPAMMPPPAGQPRPAPHELAREPYPTAHQAGPHPHARYAPASGEALDAYYYEPPRSHQPRPDGNPGAMIATARRAAATKPGDAAAAGAALRVDKAAKASRFGWLLVGGDGGKAVAGIRPGVLIVTSLAAFLLAGYWLLSGPKIGMPGSEEPTAIEQAAPRAGEPAADHPAPESAKPPSAGPTPEPQPKGISDREPSAAPAVDLQEASISGDAAQTVGPGMSVVLTGQAATVQQVVQARERARLANLSQRAGFTAARSYSAPPGTSPVETSAIAPAPSSAPAQAAVASPSPAPSLHLASAASARSLALPPAATGPLSLRLAAAQGNASAQLEIATRLAEGKGVKQSFTEAAQWYERAAAQGDGVAQYRLATLYERGMGVTADRAHARALYRQAADAGNVKAMHNLAVMSASTPGAKPDYTTAATLFTKAAEHGLTDSQYNLGVLYESGLGVPKDLAIAYRWYTLAARSGDREATRRRDALIARLPQATLEAANAATAAWRPTLPDQRANDARAAGEAWKLRAATIRR